MPTHRVMWNVLILVQLYYTAIYIGCLYRLGQPCARQVHWSFTSAGGMLPALAVSYIPMAKFLALYMAPVGAMDEMMQNTTQEQRDEQMQEWNTWMEEKKSSLVDIGAPVGRNKRITPAGIVDVRNEVGGYSIVEAASHEEAAALFADNPMLKMPGAYVEVLTIVPMP